MPKSVIRSPQILTTYVISVDYITMAVQQLM